MQASLPSRAQSCKAVDHDGLRPRSCLQYKSPMGLRHDGASRLRSANDCWPSAQSVDCLPFSRSNLLTMNSSDSPHDTVDSQSVPTPGESVAPQPAKSSSRTLTEDLLVTAFGMASSAAVAYGSSYSARELDFPLYTFMVYFIIPGGAIACGFVAAIGYWAGSRVFHHRPTRLLLWNMVLISVGTFFSIHHLDYTHAWFDGRPLSDVMSFPDYLTAVTEHMAYKVGRGAGEAMELGHLGWGVAALQIIGFSLGGLIVYGMLASAPYCDRCSRYFALLWRKVTRWPDLSEMNESYNHTAQLLAVEQLQPAVDHFATLTDRKRKMVGMLTMEIRKCPTCEKRRLKLTAQQRNGNQFATIGEVIVPTEQTVHKPA